MGHPKTMLLPLTLLLLAACQPPESTPHLYGAGMDMFTPVKMRIHPLSRIVFPSASATAPATAPAGSAITTPILEARFELTDQFGDPGKGAGTIVLELLDTSSPFAGKKPLQEWSLSLNTPQANREHWDRTTRTYLFKLPLPADFPKPSTGHDLFTLSATFTLPNNSTLSDTLDLQTR